MLRETKRPIDSPVRCPSVVVQHIRVLWTKRSRGAPFSIIRNAVPRALLVTPIQAEYVYQTHSFHEGDRAFVQGAHGREESETVPRRERFLVLGHEEDGELVVGLGWDISAGAPPRRGNHKAIRISVGESARLTINGRHTSYSGQYYSQDTFNVALVSMIHEDVFTATGPDYVYSLEVDLF